MWFVAEASNAPIINYELINATSIRIYWNITGDANGFVINITSNGLPTVTQQLTDGSAREFIYNGILPCRKELHCCCSQRVHLWFGTS